jgi:hypothetical protein
MDIEATSIDTVITFLLSSAFTPQARSVRDAGRAGDGRGRRRAGGLRGMQELEGGDRGTDEQRI